MTPDYDWEGMTLCFVFHIVHTWTVLTEFRGLSQLQLQIKKKKNNGGEEELERREKAGVRVIIYESAGEQIKPAQNNCLRLPTIFSQG